MSAEAVASPTSCPSCGAALGGETGCQSAFDQLGILSWQDARRGAVHNLMVDAYCLQHPAKYCASAKSYAAHLAGLCCGIEHPGDSARYWSIARWLDGNRALERPVEPTERGAATIADVLNAAGAEAYSDAVRAWAAAVWRAYSRQHDIARRWLAEAAAASRSHRH